VRRSEQLELLCSEETQEREGYLSIHNKEEEEEDDGDEQIQDEGEKNQNGKHKKERHNIHHKDSRNHGNLDLKALLVLLYLRKLWWGRIGLCKVKGCVREGLWSRVEVR